MARLRVGATWRKWTLSRNWNQINREMACTYLRRGLKVAAACFRAASDRNRCVLQSIPVGPDSLHTYVTQHERATIWRCKGVLSEEKGTEKGEVFHVLPWKG